MTGIMGEVAEIISEQSHITERKVWTFRYNWTVKDFALHTAEYIESSEFSSGLNDIEDLWLIYLYPKTKIHDTECMRTRLHLKSLQGLSELSVKVKYSILGSESLARYVSPTSRIRTMKQDSTIDFAEDFITRNSLLDTNQDYLPNNHLTISFEIQLVLNPSQKILTFASIKHDTELGKNLAGALESEKFSDVLFKVGDSTFKAIRGILAVRSPVLAGMFESETMKGNKINEVTISDIKPEVFKELLYFIYTNTSPNIEKMPVELLIAAEKYQLTRMKNWCEEVLIRNTNSDNVTGFFALACMNNAVALKKDSVQYIKRNLKSVAQTREFLAMKESHCKLFHEILLEMAKI